MDVHSDRRKRKNYLWPLSLLVVILLFIALTFDLSQKEKSLTHQIKKQNGPQQKSSNRNTKAELIKRKSAPSSSITQHQYLTSYNKDKKLLKECIDALKDSSVRDKDHNLKIKDYQKAHEALIVTCSLRLRSYSNMLNLVEQNKFTKELAQQNILHSPIFLMLDVFSEFINNSEIFQQYKNNLYSFLKLNLERSFIRDKGGLHAWIGMVSLMLNKCGVDRVMEGVYIAQDFRKEAPELEDVALLTAARNTQEKLNKYLSYKEEIYSIYQQRLKDFFYKYESEFENCIRD